MVDYEQITYASGLIGVAMALSLLINFFFYFKTNNRKRNLRLTLRTTLIFTCLLFFVAIVVNDLISLVEDLASFWMKFAFFLFLTFFLGTLLKAFFPEIAHFFIVKKFRLFSVGEIVKLNEMTGVITAITFSHLEMDEIVSLDTPRKTGFKIHFPIKAAFDKKLIYQGENNKIDRARI